MGFPPLVLSSSGSQGLLSAGKGTPSRVDMITAHR